MAAGEKQKAVTSATRTRARRILDILEKTHPDARIYLNFETPLQLLIATILAAQCTDEKVNEVAPRLFERYPTAADIAKAEPEDIQKIIRPTGTFRRKTKSVQEACRAIIEEHGGKVPADLDTLTQIRGVGRKTASVLVANAFGQQAIAVDTHVHRVSRRLGIVRGKTQQRIEKELRAAIPQERWTRATHLLGTHGRRICGAKKPDCDNCPVRRLCDFYEQMASN